MAPEAADLVTQAPSVGLLALMWWDLRRTVNGLVKGAAKHDSRISRLEGNAGLKADEA